MLRNEKCVFLVTMNDFCYNDFYHDYACKAKNEGIVLLLHLCSDITMDCKQQDVVAKYG